ncbi:HDOD domain-containing protein [bacterium]|nr:HDOD domain-containing protein [bacterium]
MEIVIDSRSKALAQVKHFLETEKRIPHLPQILLRVESALENAEVGGDELGRVILDDPALTVQVLKVANSTFYNPQGTKIKTISRAIVILGFDNIRRLVLGLSVAKMLMLMPRWVVYRRLWRHSLTTALLARSLAQRDGFADTEVAFVGGLLHDVGKFILGHLRSDEYAEMLKASYLEADFDLCRAESDAFYCNHQEVGGLLAQSWGLPYELVRIIGRHRPGRDWRYFDEALPGLGAYVILANQMAHLLDFEVADRDLTEALQQRAESAFGISVSEFTQLLEELEDEISQTAEFLDVALDDLRLDDGPKPESSRVLKKHIDREGLLEVTMKLSELAVLHESFAGYVEATAGQLFTALGLELLIIYLPGSKGLGLAPGFCYGSGKMAKVLGRKPLPLGKDDIINKVIEGGELASSGNPPEGTIDIDMKREYWSAGRVLAIPLQSPHSSLNRGVLLILRNLKTAPFNDDETRLLKLYSGFLGVRFSPGESMD